MWTCPRTSLPRLARMTCSVPAVMLLSVLSAGCGSHVAASRLVSEGCLPVNGRREITMRIPAPAPGTLQVQIDERGLTLVSLLDERPSTEATSPVERFGTIVLLTSTLAGQLHTVRIRPHDSPEMQGEFCLRARLLPRDDPALAEPLAAFAQGGQATQKQNWQAAFDAYLKAARGFDAVGLRVDAGQARQALAELAYRRFDRNRDAYAL